MKKIYTLIDNIGMDKFAHKYAMQSLSMVATLISFNIDPSLSPVVHSAIGAFTGLTISVSKEVLDYVCGRGFDVKDLKWDAIGIAESFATTSILL
nr:MAG TPA: putative periplasmic lipoprotein [Bacteriophage sp.]